MGFLITVCLFFLIWPVVSVMMREIPDMAYSLAIDSLNEWAESLHVHGQYINLKFGTNIMSDANPYYVIFNGNKTNFRNSHVLLYKIWRIKRLEGAGRFMDMLKCIEKYFGEKK